MALSLGMSETLVPIDNAGRIVLPKEIRDDLAISGGDVLELSVRGREVTLRPVRRASRLQRKGKALVFCSGGSEVLTAEVSQKLLEGVRSERDERAIRQLAGGKRTK